MAEHIGLPWECVQVKEGTVHIYHVDRSPRAVPIAVIDHHRDGHEFTREKLPMIIGTEIVIATNYHARLVDALRETTNNFNMARLVMDAESRKIAGEIVDSNRALLAELEAKRG